MIKVPVLIELNYIAGFKLLTFSKQIVLPDKPFYGLVIDDEVCKKGTDKSIIINLENTDTVATKIHYSTSSKRYKIEIINRVYAYFKQGTVTDWLEHYTHCNWKVETPAEAIKDFMQALEDH